MQGVILKSRAKIAFGAAQERFSDNDNENAFWNTSYRRSIIDAYSIGVEKLGWTDYTVRFEDDYFMLTAYKHYQAHRSICLWKNANEDNNGHRFSVNTAGRAFLFCTNSLREALDHFKHPVPKLSLLTLER